MNFVMLAPALGLLVGGVLALTVAASRAGRIAGAALAVAAIAWSVSVVDCGSYPDCSRTSWSDVAEWTLYGSLVIAASSAAYLTLASRRQQHVREP